MNYLKQSLPILLGITFGLNAQITELSNGNVGIGTTSPSSLLEIKSTGTTELTISGDHNGAINAGLVLQANNSTNQRGLGMFMYDAGGQNEWFAGRPYNRSDAFVIQRRSNTPRHTVLTSSLNHDSGNEITKPLFSLNNQGYVGIGTKDPSDNLEIKANNPSLKLNTLDPNGNYQLKITANHDYANKFTFDYGNVIFLQEKTIPNVGRTPNSKLYLTNYYGVGLSTGTTNPSSKEQIDLYITGVGAPNGSGNVGIGTTNPDMKLTVKGKIHTEEILVDLNVPAPDYVFQKDYNLRTLAQVEEYITENSHLPEIPSAKEFEENGVMLLEMNMNLLKKVEELTLYTIAQEKKIKKLEGRNRELNSMNHKLLELQLRLEKLESGK